MSRRFSMLVALFLAIVVVAAPAVMAQGPVSPTADSPSSTAAAGKTSHRLIVELTSPPLVTYLGAGAAGTAADAAGSAAAGIDVQSAAAQAYLDVLAAEQTAFVQSMQASLPEATVSTFMNEYGKMEEARYRVTLNGMAVDPGAADPAAAQRTLARLPGVRAVYADYAYSPTLYASTEIINAPAAWTELGGRENAGRGIKIASMDGGLHKDAPMFDGTGYQYPSGYPLGLTDNTNGKIIASRVYFRPWDPPAEGDDNPWPGESGTPHGTHTGSIAGGDVVDATFLGLDIPDLSGVAPKAYLMSYRVFYESVTGDASFYTVEGLAALEDIVADGADVLNNSWGGGPSSVGGEFDALDTALRNVVAAGIFVSMSAGNAGPGLGTGDHPSPDYMNVAASTTGSTLAAGQLRVSAPAPAPEDLQDIPFSTAEFGAPLAGGIELTYPYVAAGSVDPANEEGCMPWAATSFAGKAVLISRGICEFSQKVYLAEQAGAEFVVVYNSADGGDDLITMAGGANAEDVTISSIFVGNTDGMGMVDWYVQEGDDAALTLDTMAFPVDSQPDIIANFSSRGPSAGSTLLPDIAAPGVSILAQGYTPSATGEARHLGWGQASGTSMAAPHVAGAAALLLQEHPRWTPAQIKSALMSTAKYLEVYNEDGSPAQPLDMGAGRMDIEAALDPGVFLDPPSLTFGQVVSGTTQTLSFTVRSASSTAETYAISAISTAGGFGALAALPGVSVSPASITLAPGASAEVTVTFDSAAGTGIGENQGYIVLDGAAHEAHLPVWGRVVEAEAPASVLIIDNDASTTLMMADYASYYTDALDALGITYTLWDADAQYGDDVDVTIPTAAEMAPYDVVLYFTGDNYHPNGTFTVTTPLTTLDTDALTEYANQGGVIIAMGQDIAAVLNSDEPDSGIFFYNSVLGGNYLQDSVTGNVLPTLPVVALRDAPEAFDGMSIDLSGPDAYVGGTTLAPVQGVTTTLGGTVDMEFDPSSNVLDYALDLQAAEATQVDSVVIRRGPEGLNGPVIHVLLSGPITTDSLTSSGTIVLSDQDADALLGDALYVAVHGPGETPEIGLLRGQITMEAVVGGAGNQAFIDEISPMPFLDADPGYLPLFRYPGTMNIEDGVVAMAHRDQPSLERPGVSYLGRSVYTTFGLEGVNDGGVTSREELLGALLDWAADEPEVTIEDVSTPNASNLTTVEATVTSNIAGTTGVAYRWGFGDGTEIVDTGESAIAGHTYAESGTYTVRVEATDSWGNVALGELEIDVTVDPGEPPMYWTYLVHVMNRVTP